MVETEETSSIFPDVDSEFIEVIDKFIAKMESIVDVEDNSLKADKTLKNELNELWVKLCLKLIKR
jgi:hypothetical protein